MSMPKNKYTDELEKAREDAWASARDSYLSRAPAASYSARASALASYRASTSASASYWAWASDSTSYSATELDFQIELTLAQLGDEL